MCGIFAYLGTDKENNSVEICLEGLKHLEYRGYDSAGIAGVTFGEINAYKTVGRVADLETLVKTAKLKLSIAIAHTRWATHGQPSHYNAHPHFDHKKQLAIVHNGIIENYSTLKQSLINQGVVFDSDTDTEVIAQLIGIHYQGNLLETFKKVLPLLEGSWAVALIHKDYPDQILAATKETPLVIGYNKHLTEIYLSSDPNALKKEGLQVIYLQNDEIALIKDQTIQLLDFEGKEKKIHSEPFKVDLFQASKGRFEHFMLKEIFDQPFSIRKALEGRLSEYLGTAHFEELTLSTQELLSVNKILIVGCGTSYHAGCIAAMMLESIARIPTQVEIASEFRYSNPILLDNTLVIAISQSGETADTLAAVKEVKNRGAKVIGICNVKNSKLNREADSCLFLKAGPEISVCSTKAFTSQLTVLSLLTLFLARLRHVKKEEGELFLQDLKTLPNSIEKILAKSHEIATLAKKYSKYREFVFIGRRFMHITSLEAALKLKEISYAQACGYPAGELKHGPIALIDENLPTIALCGNTQTYSKLLSNLMEIKARKGPILAFAHEYCHTLEEICDDVLYLPKTSDVLASITYSIAAQLFAYFIAKEKGTDIDKPRNLAKSVTVE